MVSYDFYSNMKLFDPNDRDAIEWGLKRVFDYDVSKINQAIASQVLFNLMCCVLNMHLLAENVSVQVDSDSISQPHHSGGSGQRPSCGCTLA